MKTKGKTQAGKPCGCPRRRDLMHQPGCAQYGTPNWLTPSGVKAPDVEASEAAIIDMLAKSRRRKARRLIEVLHIIADASPDSTVLGLKQVARAALRAAGEAV